MAESIKAQMDRVRFLSYDFASPVSQLVVEHAEIVDAIESGDEVLAVDRLENHLRGILTSLPLIAKRYPEYFVDN